VKPDLRLLLVPAFLIAQPLAVNYFAGNERLPAAPDLSAFPKRLGNWQFVAEDPIASGVARELGADRLLSRIYRNRATNTSAGVLVAWFQSQRGGTHQPHSPKVCLPAAGWTPVSTAQMDLDTAEGKIRVNRYMVANGGQHATAIYWYETPRRAIASEWEAKLWLLADGIRDHRTDTTLVRVFVWPRPGQDKSAAEEAADLSSQAGPLLRHLLPRR
jgi:EpsI family protein